MPWKIEDVDSHIKGLSDKSKEQWVAVANSALAKCEKEGGKECDVSAIKQANGVVAKESLQAKHADIIQESALHNADISKVVGLSSKALAGEGDVNEAIKAVNEAMISLKETALVKTEDGVKYPPEAFAYASVKSSPSAWLLRLREGDKVTKRMLDKAASWLSPGGCAGKHLEIPLEEVSVVKRTIRNEYKRLGVPDEDISKWVKEAEMRNILSEYIPLSEAVVTGKGKADVVVLSPGFNTSKERYYAPETLARDFAVFEGVKMFADHPTEADEKARPERSIKDWVATLKNVKMNEKGQVIGEAVIVEPWMQEKLSTLRDKGMLNDMGISINAVGQATKQTIDGVKTNFIEKIVRSRSVDFVTSPGAGGMVNMYESGVENDVDIINIESLKERRPDLVTVIVTEAQAEFKTEAKKKMELEEKVKELETANATLLKENTDLKSSIETEKQATAKATAQAAIKEAIVKAEIPEPTKVRLQERFKDAATTDGVEDAIKAEKAYIASITETSKVKGMGATTPDSEATRKALKESFMRLGMDDKQAETAVRGK